VIEPAPLRPETSAASTEVRATSAPPAAQASRVAERITPSPASSPSPASAPSAPEDEIDDLPYSAASRLGGLRTLLVSLGLKALNKESEFHDESSEQFERTAERPVYAEPISVSPSRGVETFPPDAASVKAKPEFLPPKPALESSTEREKEKEQMRPVPKRLRWDDPQDVETLPSWRGQYRKRR
jgi:hypothetical protein